MNKWAMMKKAAIGALLLPMMLAMAACAGDLAPGNEDGDNELTPDNVQEQVAGAQSETRYGYIVEVDQEQRTIIVDSFDLVDSMDTRTLGALGVSPEEDDTYNGYYLVDTDETTLTYTLADEVELRLSDMDYGSNERYREKFGPGDGSSGSGHGPGNYSGDSAGQVNIDANSNNDMRPQAGLATQETGGDTALSGNNGGNGAAGGNGGGSDSGLNTGVHSGGNGSYQAYAGNDIAMLAQRIGYFQHIPFRIFIQGERVVKLLELDTLYN